MARMLTGLAAIHPVFARWNKQAWTREEANDPFCKMPPQVDELTQIFEEGRYFTDVTHELMPDLGYSVGAWNAIDGACGVSMRVHVGAYAKYNVFPNEVEMTFHRLEAANEDLVNAKYLKAVLLTVIDAWEPSWASVPDWDYWCKLLDVKPVRPFLSGWMTYLSAPYARKVTPPPSAITEPVAGGGILMLATNEPFTIDNLQHVAVADAIQACLEPLQTNPRLTTPAPRDKS